MYILPFGISTEQVSTIKFGLTQYFTLRINKEGGLIGERERKKHIFKSQLIYFIDIIKINFHKIYKLYLFIMVHTVKAAPQRFARSVNIM